MKITRYIKTTVEKAKDLQQRYNKLGASKHQSVRNFKPMRELVKDILPILPAPLGLMRVTGTVTFGTGTDKQTRTVNNLLVMGMQQSMAQTQGLTVLNILQTLEEKGFVATIPGVRSAIFQLNAKSVTDPTPLKKRGCPPKRYFLVNP